MAKRKKLHEVSLEDDIRFRGPISFQGFQVLGWLCIVVTFAMALLNIARSLDPLTAETTKQLMPILQTVSALSLPFLLIANYSRILSNFEGYKKQLLRTGGSAAAIIGVSYIIYIRYLAGFFNLFFDSPGEGEAVLEELIQHVLQNGFVAYNIFIDLFLCTLFMFFMSVRPKRVFTGKKVLILRFLSLLPVAYELASLWLKYLAASHQIVLPFWVFPLLTVKPPMTFLLFMLLAIHIKARERRFCRHGRTHEEYMTYLTTNRNSLHFSGYLIFLLFLTAVLDLIALIMFSAFSALKAGAPNDESVLLGFLESASALGFGKTAPQLLLMPLMLLFSYSRIPKSKTLGMLIPVFGVGMMVLVLLEFCHAALDIYVPQLKANIAESLETTDSDDIEEFLLMLKTMDIEDPPDELVSPEQSPVESAF